MGIGVRMPVPMPVRISFNDAWRYGIATYNNTQQIMGDHVIVDRDQFSLPEWLDLCRLCNVTPDAASRVYIGTEDGYQPLHTVAHKIYTAFDGRLPDGMFADVAYEDDWRVFRVNITDDCADVIDVKWFAWDSAIEFIVDSVVAHAEGLVSEQEDES